VKGLKDRQGENGMEKSRKDKLGAWGKTKEK